MEPSGRNRVATAGKWETAGNGSDRRKPLPWVATACRRGLHGKEGVDGSSPSEGLGKVPANRDFNVVCP
jgi:hypothetical protein